MKQPSRTSARNRQNIDYNDLGSGKNLDYNDIAVTGGQKGQAKPKNIKVNQEVMKGCNDFFKMIKDSSYWMQLQAIVNSVPLPAEFKKTLEELDIIEKNCQAHKYQNTSMIHVDTMKLLLKISGKLGTNLEMITKVNEFTSYMEKLMENYDLMNKEIYTSQPAPAQMTDSQIKKGPKDMEKIRKDLD